MERLNLLTLRSLAKSLGMRGYSKLRKFQLIDFIKDDLSSRPSPPIPPRPLRPTPKLRPQLRIIRPLRDLRDLRIIHLGGNRYRFTCQGHGVRFHIKGNFNLFVGFISYTIEDDTVYNFERFVNRYIEPRLTIEGNGWFMAFDPHTCEFNFNPKQAGGGGIRPQAGSSPHYAETVSSRKLKLCDFYYILIGFNCEYKPVPWGIHCCHGNAIVEGCLV